MLDLLEKFGINFDSFDSGQSLRLHRRIRPNAKPQSICSAVTDARLWCIVWAIGFEHCARSWWRYHGDT